jgi:uncharacterized membrane protein YraQ (UPF0718 family)
MARAAGRLAGRWLPVAKSAANTAKAEATKRAARAGDQWVPAARRSGSFVKHVLPAVAKPIHSLWHQVLGFIFLAVAASGVWKIWSKRDTIELVPLVGVLILVIVMAAYGIASIRKSRRISRS